MSGIDDSLREELGALLDGALEEPRASEVSARIKSDEVVRREYNELKATIAAVRGLPRETVDLRAAVREKMARPPARVVSLRERWFVAAAVLMIGVAVALFEMRDAPKPRPLAEAAHEPSVVAPPEAARTPGEQSAGRAESEESEEILKRQIVADPRDDAAPFEKKEGERERRDSAGKDRVIVAESRTELDEEEAAG